jgi:hypothetical protein
VLVGVAEALILIARGAAWFGGSGARTGEGA